MIVMLFLLSCGDLDGPLSKPVLEWSPVPGGTTLIGAKALHPEEGPPTRTVVKSVQMSVTEVQNADFARFVDATGHVTSAERGTLGKPAGSWVFFPPTTIRGTQQPGSWQFVLGATWRHPEGPGSDWKDRPTAPVVHVSHADARAFAAWMGARLPTEAEWEHAARRGATPGNVWQGGFPTLNTAEDGHEGTAPAKAFAPSDDGIYDLLGNVWEWTADRAPDKPGARWAKGGSFLCDDSFCARARPEARLAQGEMETTNHLGFRVVKD
ncbi:MAG: SUMF1/EgtB/PvdO family nonheme iron enzyme [Myxococcota bacterium]